MTAVGPCATVTGVPPGTAIGIGGNPLGIPPLDDGSFPAAPGSSIANVHDGILANTCPNCNVFTDPITTDEQLRAISAFLSTGEDVFLNSGASRFPRVFFTEQSSDYTDFLVSADWSPRDGTMFYGKVASGHKAGSQEIFYLPRLHQFINSILEPEELISYEGAALRAIADDLNVPSQLTEALLPQLEGKVRSLRFTAKKPL